MPSGPKLRILLAEDHRLLRESLRSLIEAQDDMEVVAEAADGGDAIRLCAAVLPAIAVVDVSMPGIDGIQVTRILARQCPQVRVIALTRHKDKSFVTKMLSVGAAGYVLKQNAAAELTRALRAVAEGARFIDPVMQASLQSSELPETQPLTAPGEESLTTTEQEVLRLLAASFSNHEIGARLSLDAATLSELRASGMRKLKLATRLDLLRYAIDHRW